MGKAEGHMFTSGVSMKEEDRRAGHTAAEYRTSSQVPAEANVCTCTYATRAHAQLNCPRSKLA